MNFSFSEIHTGSCEEKSFTSRNIFRNALLRGSFRKIKDGTFLGGRKHMSTNLSIAELWIDLLEQRNRSKERVGETTHYLWKVKNYSKREDTFTKTIVTFVCALKLFYQV